MDCSDGPWQLRELISVPSWIICTKYHSLAWKWRQVSSREGGKVTWKKYCSFSKFPSWAFQVLERSSFWAFWCVCEWSFLFGGRCIDGMQLYQYWHHHHHHSIHKCISWMELYQKISHLPRCNKGPSVANIIWEELDLLSTLHSLAKITINFSRRPLLVTCRAFG